MGKEIPLPCTWPTLFELMMAGSGKTRGSGTGETSIRGGQRWRGDDSTHNGDGSKFFRRIHVVCIRGGITFVDFLLRQASSSRFNNLVA